MRVLGYARRSKGEAGLDDYEFDGQRRLMQATCDARNWTLIDVIEEVADISVPPLKRKGMQDAVTRVGEGEADSMMVTRVDRIGLALPDFTFLNWLTQAGRFFVALDAGWDTSTEGGAEAARILRHLGVDAGWLANTMVKPRWNGRNRVLVKHIPPGSSVVDLGSGAQTLRELLPEGCTYQPCDVVDGSDVLRCDFKRDIWPRLPQVYDVVVVSGVMEYLDRPRDFLSRLPTLGKTVLLTHALRPESGPVGGRTWPTHLTQRQLEAMLTELDISFELVDKWNAHGIYALEGKPSLTP